MAKKHGKAGIPHRMAVNSLDAIRPYQWQKGQSGNAGHKNTPKRTFTSTLLEVLELPAGETPWTAEKLTWRQALTLSWLKRAMTEGLAFKEMLERVDGKVLLPVSIDMRAEAEKVARKMGLDVGEVLKELDEILKGVGR